MVAAATTAGVLAQRRFDRRAVTAGRLTLKVMLYGIVPIVAFFNIANLRFSRDLAVGIAFGWAALCAVGFIAFWVAHLLKLGRPAAGTLMATTMLGNTGYLGLPLVVSLLGPDQLGQAVIYDQLVQTSFLLTVVFAMAAAMGTAAGEGVRDRVVAFFSRNPPLLAVVLGLVAPSSLAPDALVDASRLLAYTLVPLGFFAVGVTLAGESADGPSFRPPFDRTVAAALALRLVVAPALLLALSAPFIDLPASWLLLAAMPSGVNGLVVAHTYGLDLRLAAAAIVYSTTVVVTVGLGAAALT